jgi:hypothetical protein
LELLNPGELLVAAANFTGSIFCHLDPRSPVESFAESQAKIG